MPGNVDAKAANIAPGATPPLARSALNPDQRAFCDLPPGPTRLLAPAGCGKTQSLLWRCWTLARDQGREPKFLVFTFTRAARDELRERLSQSQEFKGLHSLVHVTTLNSWGFRQVKAKMHRPRLLTSGSDRYFLIENVLQPVWREFPRLTELLTDSRRRARGVEAIYDLIDRFKALGFSHVHPVSIEAFSSHLDWMSNHGMSRHVDAIFRQLEELEIVRPDGGGRKRSRKKRAAETSDLPTTVDAVDSRKQAFGHFMKFWAKACMSMYQSSCLTMEDQKYWALFELQAQMERTGLARGAVKVDHILVDEFQDINPLDLNLLGAISRFHQAPMTIVGDDDQAIYEWRGATPEFILEPDTHIGGGFATHVLGVNYRSPRNIVDHSQRLIAHNERRVPKEVRAHSDATAEIMIARIPDVDAGIEHTLAILERVGSDEELRNLAIIGRKRGQLIPYQIVLASRGIPFFAAEDLHVLLSSAFDELKKIIAIRAKATMGGMFGADPVADLVFLCDKLKRYPLRRTDREGLVRYLQGCQPETFLDAVRALARYTGPIKGSSDGRMAASFAEAILALLETSTVAETIKAISEGFDGLQKDYGKSQEDVFYADPPFLYLVDFAQRYGADYERFYKDVEKAKATLARIPPDDDETPDTSRKRPVHLMTALRAKGKEFDAVVILDANQGIWPSKLATTPEELEQERRVFYVAVTRPRKHLTFLVADQLVGEKVAPSQYLEEMGLSHMFLD